MNLACHAGRAEHPHAPVFRARRALRPVLFALAALASLPAQATPTAEAIRAALAQGGAMAAPPSRRAAGDPLQQLYASRDYRPLWNDPVALQSLARALRAVERDGLDPDDYLPPNWRALRQRAYAQDSARARAAFDLRITRAYLSALEQVAFGKLDPSAGTPVQRRPPPLATRVSPAWAAAAAAAGQAELALAQARPPYRLYDTLVSAYARYRSIAAAGGWDELPAEPVLRPGMTHGNVELLRKRLAAEDETLRASAEPQRYDETLAEVVRRFQRELYLQADGIVGGATRDALNVPAAARAQQLRVNLERARWLLQDLPQSYVLVDIAGYKLTYFRPGGEVWRTGVVVGKPYRATPEFRSELEKLIFNPTWTVPPTIFKEDIAPKAAGNARAILEKKHLRALDGQGGEVAPERIDWSDSSGVILRQDPGPENPLGQVKMDFDNPFQVYLHDTPSKDLFDEERRANSSGCIRVENALELARLLLDDGERWSAQDIRRFIADRKTKEVPLPRRVPVILHYWTVDAVEDGSVRFKPDIYGRDGQLLAALDG